MCRYLMLLPALRTLPVLKVCTTCPVSVSHSRMFLS